MPQRHSLPGPGVSLGLPLLLRAIRSARRLSQRELASRAGLPKTTVARLESGSTRDPLMSTVERVVAAAGYRLAVVDRQVDHGLDEISSLDIPGPERDRAGRHLPAHLARALLRPGVGWWGWGRVAWEFTDDPRPENVYYLRSRFDDPDVETWSGSGTARSDPVEGA